MVRSAKRVMGRAKISPRSRIVLAPDIYSGMGRALEKLVYAIEKRYAATLYVSVLARPTNAQEQDMPLTERGSAGLKKALLDLNLPQPPSSINDCIRLERALALRVAEIVGAGTILVNLNRSLANIVAIESLLRREPWILGDLEESWSHEGVLIVAPLINVEAQSIAAYGYLRGYLSRPAYDCKPLADKTYYSVAWERPELEFSSTRSLGFLGQTVFFRELSRCKICKGYSPGEVCPHCSRMGLDRASINVEVSGRD